MSKSTAPRAPTRSKPGAQQSQATGATARVRAAARKRSAKSQSSSAKILQNQRQQLIAQTAYFIAERRGFVPGGEREDWLQAEAEIDAFLKAALK